ncbi:MAG: hypothetical protein FH757_01540 [Alcanivorax sp.]|nr:hypothetical protein [Alcanivorax sp.]
MDIKLIRNGIIGSTIAAALAFPATSMAQIYYKPDGSGGWQGPAQSEPVPTSYADAVENGFFYIFDSHYPVKDGGGWAGELVTLDGRLFGGVVAEADCRLQLGGYIWEDGSDTHVAVTHARVGKEVPEGFPPNDELCTDGSIDLFFNNGLPGGAPYAGAWHVNTATTNVSGPNATFMAPFTNVQVTALGMNCSNATGNSGNVPTTYADNGAGTRASFDFSATISPNGIFSCAVDGTLHSVWEKAVLNEPDWTPSAPGPVSPLSRGVVDYIQ